MKLIELLGCTNVLVRIINPKVPDVYDGVNNWVVANSFTFPSDIVYINRLCDVGYANQILLDMTYFDKSGRPNIKYVSSQIEVELLDTKDHQKLIDMYDQYIMANLINNLGRYFRVGSDPEIFVEDEKGQVIPAYNFLGSKKEPNRTANVNYGNLPLYWDGPQAEFETSAQDCLAWQVDSVQAGLKALHQLAKKHNPKAKLSIKTVMDISMEELQNAKEEHITFGCMPSFNAYDMSGRQVAARELPFRSAGGHIHFGVGKKDKDSILRMVKALDAILGVACVSLFAKYDDPRRRQFYGLAGEYRLPKHGLEYRTLSNAWLFHPVIMNMVFDLGRKALVFGEKGMLKYWKGSEQETIECINSCNVKKAREILERNQAIFYMLFESAYGKGDLRAKVAVKTFMNGMESLIKDPTDFVTNWTLEGEWVTHSEGKNVAAAARTTNGGKTKIA